MIRLMLFISFALGALTSLAFAGLPLDNHVYRLQTEDSGLWLGAKPVKAQTSLLKAEGSATRWKFHAIAGGVYAIESQDDGARWLTLDKAGQVRLAMSDSGLAARWMVSETATPGHFTLQNTSLPLMTANQILATGNTLGLGTAATAFVLKEQTVDALPFSHGDVIGLKSMAAETGNLWLNGATTSGTLNLVDGDGAERDTGAVFRVHDNQNGSFSFECLGNIPGRRWLTIRGEAPGLATTTDRNESTQWKVILGPNGTFRLKNVSTLSKEAFLDSYPSTAIVQMSADDKSAPGTYWQAKVRHAYDATVEGRWSAVEDLDASGIHTHLLPNGKILYWSRFSDPTDYDATTEGIPVGKTATFLYDPATALTSPLPNAAFDTFCSGHTFLPDGTLLVTGGHIRSYVGQKATQTFDYESNTWTTDARWDMNEGRWYPTSIPLASGDVLTVSGDATSAQDVNRTPQVWSYHDKVWRDLTGLESSCFNAEGKGPCLPLYPWLHQTPNGRVFISGPGQETGYIDTEGDGTWQFVGNTNHGYRGDYEATSTMYEPGKILIAGGLPSTASAEIIDLNAKDPAWREIEAMHHARHKLTSTILADGQVLIVGGTSNDGNADDFSEFSAEIWNPATREWTEVDHEQVPRLYHSSSVLLPDGRVYSQGGGVGAGYTTHKNYQIFSPPYLFKGARPTYTLSAQSFDYGEAVTIATPDADAIAMVHVIRLSSDTHSFNSGQYRVPLEFKAASRGVSATMPQSGAWAPPGHYLLFIVNKAGVPSIAQIIQIGTKDKR